MFVVCNVATVLLQPHHKCFFSSRFAARNWSISSCFCL